MSITSKCDWCGRTVDKVPGKVLLEATTNRMARKHICFDCLRKEVNNPEAEGPAEPDMFAREEK